jgi:hypothetical protein
MDFSFKIVFFEYFSHSPGGTIQFPRYGGLQPQKKPSALQRKHKALKTRNILFLYFFVDHFCPTGSRSTDPVESSSNLNPVKNFIG